MGKRSAESKHEHRTKQRRLREESAQAAGGSSLERGALAGGACGAAPLYGVPSPYIQGALAGELHHYTFGLEAPAALEDHTDGTEEQEEDDADTGWAQALGELGACVAGSTEDRSSGGGARGIYVRVATAGAPRGHMFGDSARDSQSVERARGPWRHTAVSTAWGPRALMDTDRAPRGHMFSDSARGSQSVERAWGAWRHTVVSTAWGSRALMDTDRPRSLETDRRDREPHRPTRFSPRRYREQ